MSKARIRLVVLVNVLLVPVLLAGSSVAAAPQQAAELSRIVVRGTGSVPVAPDRAKVLFSIDSQAPNPADAANGTAAIQAATLDALRGAGVAQGDVTSVGYSVSPDWRRDENGNQEIVGYTARSTVLLETASLGRVGALIDVALSAGVTGVRSVEFEASDVDDARRQALVAATRQARLDAEAIAQAAGGRLGRLVEVTLETPSMETGVALQRYAPAPTQLEPGQQLVTATVLATWRFDPD